jgi:hypothetical protein
LYFGAAADGEKVQIMNNVLYARYDEYIPLNVKFEVKSYVLSTRSGMPITVSGSTIVENVMLYLQSLNKGDTFTIVAKVVGPDGINREVKGSYKL